MKSVHLDIVTYNAIPADKRKTANGARFAWVNGEWQQVLLPKRVRTKDLKGQAEYVNSYR